jgi:hypothetical protein
MRKMISLAMIVAALAAPALADSYPVSGRWGQSTSSEKGAIDCAGKRVIDFKGDQRTDSKGGVPAYRNKSVSVAGPSSYRIVDQFSNGQVRNGSVNYTLRQADADHIEMNMSPGGTLKLQRCE